MLIYIYIYIIYIYIYIYIICFVLFCFVHVLVGCRQWCQALGLAQCEKGGFALAVTLGHFRIHKICLHWSRFDALTFLTPYIPAWLCIVALPAAKSCFCNNFLLQRQSSCQDPKYLLAIAGGVAAIGVIAELPCLRYRNTSFQQFAATFLTSTRHESDCWRNPTPVGHSWQFIRSKEKGIDIYWY